MSKSTLTVVGSGIKFISHLTTEAKTHIKDADKVLFLVNEPAMKQWLLQANTSAESLEVFYDHFILRSDCYKAISKYILETLKKNQNTCVVLYGHPAVFAKPALDAVRHALAEGFAAKVLPGISADACLFADLLIDPGTCGYQSYETTDFLLHKRNFEVSSHLVLWQLGIIGILDYPISHDNSKGVKILIEYLTSKYPITHVVTLYEAAQYPTFDPQIINIPLSDLPTLELTGRSTLYIPPLNKAEIDTTMLHKLGMKLNELVTEDEEGI